MELYVPLMEKFRRSSAVYILSRSFFVRRQFPTFLNNPRDFSFLTLGPVYCVMTSKGARYLLADGVPAPLASTPGAYLPLAKTLEEYESQKTDLALSFEAYTTGTRSSNPMPQPSYVPVDYQSSESDSEDEN